MTDDGKGGVAFLVATVAGLATMALHPTSHDLFGASQPDRVAALNVFVHGLAIASAPLSFLGALALSKRLSAPDRFSLAALVIYGFALVAVISAAAVSGFVVTGLARDAEPIPRAVYQLAGLLNQAFAKIYLVASCCSLVLWSLAIMRGRALPRGLAIYGLAAGALLIAAVVTGSLRLDVHGFGLAVLLQAVWFISAGILLLRPRAA